MDNRERSALARFFIGAWKVIDGTRRFVLNAAFFLLRFVFVMAILDSGDALVVHPETALLTTPRGGTC